MSKMMRVARHEFMRHLKRRGFLFGVFGLPLLLIAVFAIAIFIITGRMGEPIGIVDHAGILLEPEAYSETLEPGDPALRAFADEESARETLLARDIQAYVVVPAGYPEVGDVDLYHTGDPSETLYRDVSLYLRTSLLRHGGADAEMVTLLAEGDVDTEYISLREGTAENEIGSFLFPYLAGMLLVMTVFTSAGYMLQAVVDEKENRTMEILITSVSPRQLIGGKVVGLVGLGLVQSGVWFTVAATGLLIAGRQVDALSTLRFPTDLVLVALAFFLPFYVLMASIMVAIGLSVTEVSEGQQASTIVSLLAVIPFWLLAVIIPNPDGPLSIGLSLFPFTSPLTILVRYPLTEIPFWQLALSWLLIVAAAVLALRVVAYVMRVGMLRYGKRVTLRELGRGLRKAESI